MKDPAFLFYPNDYIGGTMGMSFEEKGAYIEILMMQFNRGHMTEHMIRHTVGQLWDKLVVKFIKDDAGLYYNERLEIEINKRKNYVNSRRNNISGTNQHTKKEFIDNGYMTSHMENRNENENIVINTDTELITFDDFRKKYLGTKRGNETEFKNFQKKNKDWKECLSLLLPALENQIKVRELKKQKSEFVPEWKNLTTWINQRCWEEEIQVAALASKRPQIIHY